MSGSNTPRQRPMSPGRARIPNALTILRLILAAAFFVLLGWRPGGPLVEPAQDRGGILLGAAALFIVAALTDALDGYLARRWNVVSRFGRVMDPFADKVLVLGAFVFLAAPAFQVHLDMDGAVRRLQISGVHAWMVVVILARELLVTSLRGAYEARGVDFSASASGKLKMILQSVTIPLVLVLPALFDATGGWARVTIDMLVWACVIVTAASAVPYVARAIAANANPGAP